MRQILKELQNSTPSESDQAKLQSNLQSAQTGITKELMNIKTQTESVGVSAKTLGTLAESIGAISNRCWRSGRSNLENLSRIIIVLLQMSRKHSLQRLQVLKDRCRKLRRLCTIRRRSGKEFRNYAGI